MQSNIKNARRWLALMIATAALLVLSGVAAVGLAPHEVAAAPAEQFGAVVAPRSVTLYGPTVVTTGTYYSAAPLNVNSIDNARTTNYARADVFAWTDAGSTGTVTVPVQASPDETNWTNVMDAVHTFSSTGTLISNSYINRVVLAGASANGMARVVLAGEFLRVKLDAVGPVTPTVKVTLR